MTKKQLKQLLKLKSKLGYSYKALEALTGIPHSTLHYKVTVGDFSLSEWEALKKVLPGLE